MGLVRVWRVGCMVFGCRCAGVGKAKFGGVLIQFRPPVVIVAIPRRVMSMIFGFSQFVPKLKAVPKARCDSSSVGGPDTQTSGDFRQRAQVFDLAHERRLRALNAYIEQGYSLSEAARLLGVSRLTVVRWNDHGRR